MTTQKHLNVFTEKEVRKYIQIDKPYRPSQTAIWIIKKGNITVHYDSTPYDLEELSILLVSSKNIYKFSNISEDIELRALRMHPELKSLESIKIRRYNYISFLNVSMLNHFKLTPETFNNFWTAIELLEYQLKQNNESSIYKEIIHHLFLSIIYLWAEIADKYRPQKVVHLNISQKMSFEFIRLLSIHGLDKRNIGYYADLLNISTKHLSETVKICTGYTAGEVINQFILTEAKVLLSDNTLTIKQIAEHLNFSDQYTFSHFFKRQTQISPSEFKKGR
jgi:AraC-like DNA-binding protein/mannose-6-phosphate isomerase-like protein (cupin superfamily)